MKASSPSISIPSPGCSAPGVSTGGNVLGGAGVNRTIPIQKLAVRCGFFLYSQSFFFLHNKNMEIEEEIKEWNLLLDFVQRKSIKERKKLGFNSLSEADARNIIFIVLFEQGKLSEECELLAVREFLSLDATGKEKFKELFLKKSYYYNDVHLGELEFDECSNCQLLLESTAKFKNNIWRIHKNDQDPFPSNPHAHKIDSDITLDLSNGLLYKNRKYIGEQMKKKDFMNFRAILEGKNIPLPDLSI